MSGVGTRYIQFVGSDAFAVVENLNGSFVVFARVAEHVGEYNDVLNLPEPRQLFFEECRCADILQANSVEHAGSGFPQAWRRIADHWLARQAFDDEASELIEMNNIFKLDSVAKGPACRDDRVL